MFSAPLQPLSMGSMLSGMRSKYVQSRRCTVKEHFAYCLATKHLVKARLPSLIREVRCELIIIYYRAEPAIPFIDIYDVLSLE